MATPITLNERDLGSIATAINIVMQLDTTNHAGERQFRHGEGDYISERQIREVVEKSLSKIVYMLVFDKIDIGDYVVISSKSTGLNVVGVLKMQGGSNLDSSKIDLVIITVMRKDNFKAKTGTQQIYVERQDMPK